jgi:hypothetical protein
LLEMGQHAHRISQRSIYAGIGSEFRPLAPDESWRPGRTAYIFVMDTDLMQ